VRWGLVPANAALSAQLPGRDPDDQRQMRIWSLDECHRFLEVAGESTYGPLWIVLLGTGVRIGEGLGLRWSDLDLDHVDQRGQPAPRMRVVQTVEPVRGRPEPQELPKTRSSRRTLPLQPEIARALREHRARQNERRLQAGPTWHDLDLVLAARNGSPLHHAGYDRDLDLLCAKAGVPRITVHEIRHTYASRTLEEGVPLEIVSKLLGDADISTPARIYAHITEDMKRKGARTAGAALFRWGPGPRGRNGRRGLNGGLLKRVCATGPENAKESYAS
jgi:integrase